MNRCATCLLVIVGAVVSLPNGAALRAPLGWSTWLTFKLSLNESLVRSSAEFLANSELAAGGYDYILLDDGWSVCERSDTEGNCVELPSRDKDGRIPVDPAKFPSGFKSVTDYVHSLGLKVGIYTGVSNRTCGGYWGSLGHEKIDAEAFAEWGFDFVKHDTCSPGYCGVYGAAGHAGTPSDGNCIRHSTTLMSEALQAAAKALHREPIVYYIDHGNPTSPQKVYNPFLHHVPTKVPINPVPGTQQWRDATGMNSQALTPSELGYTWGGGVAHMMKIWYDREDTWDSFLTNVHSQVGLAPYQHCGFFLAPDMLTIGMGGMSPSQERAQFLMYAILGAPLVLAADIRKLSAAQLALLTAPEVLAVDQDPQCVQGSRTQERGASEVWVKPLADASFAVVMLNKGQALANVTLAISDHGDNTDFFPAYFSQYRVRDLLQRRDLGGSHKGDFTAQVEAHDAIMYKFTPLNV